MASDIAITKKFRCETVFSELNDLLKRILEMREEAETEKGYSFEYDIYKDYEGLVEILLNILYEKSNLKSEVTQSKNSLNIHDLGDTFKSIESYKDESDLYERFLLELKEALNREMQIFSFIVPLNIEFKGEEYKKDLDEILELFDLSLIDLSEIEKLFDSKTGHSNQKDEFSEIEPTKDQILEILKNYHVILLAEVNARSLYYADNEAYFRVKSFLGFLSFVNIYLKETEYYGQFEDYSLSNFDFDIFIVIGYQKVISPTTLKLEFFESKPKESFKEKKFDSLKVVFDDFKKIGSDSLKNVLKTAFYNYFGASTEKTLNYSFLKFWIIIEEMIKSGGSKTEDELNEIIKSLLHEDILKKRVDKIQKTRNLLVHTGKSASTNDRNLTKLFADLIITDALRKMSKLKNKKQYDYYLSNLSKKPNNRKELVKVLKLLNTNEI